ALREPLRWRKRSAAVTACKFPGLAAILRRTSPLRRGSGNSDRTVTPVPLPPTVTGIFLTIGDRRYGQAIFRHRHGSCFLRITDGAYRKPNKSKESTKQNRSCD